MTKLTQYSEAFWGPEFLSTAGFDVLTRHNGEEKKFLQEFEDFLRKRSKMELEYSRSLGQLTKSFKDHSSRGAVGASWNCLRRELEVCKNAHDEAGLYFSQHAEETKRFCRALTTRRDIVEERMKKAQNQKASQFRNVTSLSKTYRQKCREKDQAKDAYAVLRREVTSTFKELDKAKSKMEKSEEEANKADAAYKNAVSALEEIRQDWEREMEWACKELQESDEEQIMFLRAELWTTVNRTSQVSYDVDQSCEQVRQVLETCDVDQDIQNFIANNSTGAERPGPVLYQNYYETGTVGTTNHRAGFGSSDNSHHRQAMAPPTLSPYDNAGIYSMVQDNDTDPRYVMDDPTYSSVTPVWEPSHRLLTVCKSFQTPPNFSVHAGEKVILVRKVNANLVEVRTSSNKTGNLPMACIREVV